MRNSRGRGRAVQDVVGVWVLVGTLLVAGAGGLVLRARDGRFRPRRRPSATLPSTAAAAAASVPAADAGRASAETGAARAATRRAPAETGAARAATRRAPAETGAARAGTGPARAEAGVGSDLRDEVLALGREPGDRATLLQFSSAFCAPCRATRRVLADVAATVPGVTHVDVDAEAHLDLVRRLDVRRTPTVLVLDAAGREVRRASGAPPHKAAVLAAIASGS